MADISFINRHGTQRLVFDNIDTIEVDNADSSGVVRYLLQGTEKQNTVWWTVGAVQDDWYTIYFNRTIDWDSLFIGLTYFDNTVEIGAVLNESQTLINFFCYDLTQLSSGLYVLACYNVTEGITQDNFKIIYSTKAFNNVQFNNITISAVVGWNSYIFSFGEIPGRVVFYDNILGTYENVAAGTEYEPNKYYEKVGSNYILLDSDEAPAEWAVDCTVYYEKVYIDVSTIAAGTPIAFGTQDKTAAPSASDQVITADSGYSSLQQVKVSGTPLQSKTNITPTTSSQTITADQDYYGLSSVQIDAIKLENKTVSLRFPNGATTQVVYPSTGYNMSRVTINKPSNLIPGNIAKDVVIAEITGTFEGGKPEETKNITLDFSGGAQTQSVPATTGYVMTDVIIERPSNLQPYNILDDITIAGVTGNVVMSLSDQAWVVGQNFEQLYFWTDPATLTIFNNILPYETYSETISINGLILPAKNYGFTYLYAVDAHNIVSNLYMLVWYRNQANPIIVYSTVSFESSTLGLKVVVPGFQRKYIEVGSNISLVLNDVRNLFKNFVFGIGGSFDNNNSTINISPLPEFSKYYRPSYLINAGDTLSAIFFNTQYNPDTLFPKLYYNQSKTIVVGGNSVTIDYCLLGLNSLIAVDLSSIDISLVGEYAIFWDNTPVYSTIEVSSIGINKSGWLVNTISSINVIADYSIMNAEFLKVIDEIICKRKTIFGADDTSSGGATIDGNTLKLSDESYVSNNVLHLASDVTISGNTLVLSGSSPEEEQIFARLNTQLWGSNS